MRFEIPSHTHQASSPQIETHGGMHIYTHRRAFI
jgi:hypothetical protein